jgi:paraquat-inducible protein A
MTPAADAHWLACPRCHAPCRNHRPGPGEFLRCRRCGEQLASSRGILSISRAWALSTTALILLVLANMEPILSFSIAGKSQENLIITGVDGLWAQGYEPLALLVLFSAIVAPFLYLASVWYVAAACCTNRMLPFARKILNMSEVLESWALLPVFATACALSVVKLRTLGHVSWESGAMWIALASAFTLLTVQAFDRRTVESWMEGER